MSPRSQEEGHWDRTDAGFSVGPGGRLGPDAFKHLGHSVLLYVAATQLRSCKDLRERKRLYTKDMHQCKHSTGTASLQSRDVCGVRHTHSQGNTGSCTDKPSCDAQWNAGIPRRRKYQLVKGFCASGRESYLSASNDLNIGPSKAASRAVPPAVRFASNLRLGDCVCQCTSGCLSEHCLVYLGVAIPAGERLRLQCCGQVIDEPLGMFKVRQTVAPSFHRSDVITSSVNSMCPHGCAMGTVASTVHTHVHMT